MTWQLVTASVSIVLSGAWWQGCAASNEPQAQAFPQPAPSMASTSSSSLGVVTPEAPATIDLANEPVREVLVLKVAPSTPGPAFAVRATLFTAGRTSVSLGPSVVSSGQADATFLLRVPPEVLTAWRDAPVDRSLQVALIAVDPTGTLPASARVTVSFRETE